MKQCLNKLLYATGSILMILSSPVWIPGVWMMECAEHGINSANREIKLLLMGR